MYQKSVKAGSQSGIGPWNGSGSNSMCEEEKMNEINENHSTNKNHIEENGTKVLKVSNECKMSNAIYLELLAIISLGAR